MKDTTLSASLHLPNEALLFDLNALYACLQTIPDHRDRRGVRYPRAAPAHGRGACPHEQDKMVFVGWHSGPNCEPRNARELFHLKRERMPH